MSWLNHFSAFESREVLDLIIIFNLSSDFRHTGPSGSIWNKSNVLSQIAKQFWDLKRQMLINAAKGATVYILCGGQGEVKIFIKGCG